MKRANRIACAAAVLLLLGAATSVSAQDKPKSGTAGKEQVWQVEFVVGDDHYTGTMTLATAKGTVTGKMLIDSPTKVEGQVEGKQDGDTLSLDYAFTMVDDKCTGRVQVQAKLAAEGQEASGTAHVTDCNGQPVDGTVTMKKARKVA
jgi:hypothetical protein